MTRVLNFPIRSLPRWWNRGTTIAVIVLLSALLHAWAVWQLPLDYDEPVYLRAGQDYGGFMRAGDLRSIVNYSENREHPPLVKLLYGLPTAFYGPTLGTTRDLIFARSLSALFGVLAVWAVARFEPTAGFLLAFNSLFIKYTSQAYLEALPLLASTLAVLLFFRAAQPGEARRGCWLALSAASLGFAAAGKYNYGLAVVPIALVALQHRKLGWRQLAGYALAAAAVFWLANPYLWRDPIDRLAGSLLFHSGYSQSFHVLSSGYPWYQPLVWISSSVPWHPGVFFYPTLDELSFLFALVGLYVVGRRRPWLAFWPVILLLVLFLWPTKWPQYALLLVPPISLLAGATLRYAVAWGREQDNYWDYLGEMLPQPPRIFWWAAATFVLVLGLGKVVYEYQRALDRRGWSAHSGESAPLPGESIYDLEGLPDGRVVLATSGGAALWMPEGDIPWGRQPALLGEGVPGLENTRVSSILVTSTGELWLGTEQGAARQEDDGSWVVYPAAEMGLPSAQVRDLVEDSQGGIWAGTLAGLSRFNGQSWLAHGLQADELLDPAIFTLAVQPAGGGDVIWAGGRLGVSRLDTRTGEWKQENFSSGLGWRGVADLLVDSRGQVWAATLGGGLRRWDGSEWTIYRVSQDGMPTSMVNQIIETTPGLFWIGFSHPSQPGGQLATFDGQDWRVFSPSTSGYGGREPLALYRDPKAQLWIGTAGEGLVIFDTSYLEK